MSRSVPELAGLATYHEAAIVGLAVSQSVRRLLRGHWAEIRLMDTILAHLPRTPEWEVKCALSLHQWQHAEHATLLRERISEMRNPVPRLDVAPDDALSALFAELEHSADSVELLTGIYTVVRPAMAESYRDHYAAANPLVDHPTRRLLQLLLADEDDAARWGRAALDAMIDGDEGAARRSAAWRAHLGAFLTACGGIAGDVDGADAPLPSPRAVRPFVPDLVPRRDSRFKGQLDFDFPPHVIYNDPRVPPDERNLALLCKRALEMDVPEMMAGMLVEWRGLPWELRRALSRQLWDEARHAMMGTVALEARGLDWTRIPLNIGFALRLGQHAEPLERQIMLWAIEQSLMSGDTGKRSEYETAVEAGDALSAHFQDYDWADEVLHARIGRQVLKHAGVTAEQAMARAPEIHERTWHALDAYRQPDECAGWWDDFVRQALGRPSALGSADLQDLRILTE
ncbi:MAG TPA: hypothetical protein VMM77_09060 [Gemmatimonadaceae bacterium]|nr:hypothetical protein [Gemmatimonadaceae bacterium]